MVMRMLAEMAVANPSTGSFADYSRKALGDWAGFSVGWLYWYFWVIVVGFEAVAGAKVINFWLPGVPTWVLSLLLMLLMTGTNLISVSSFGEFEFWFAGIKVAAIIVFLACGALFVFGIWPNADLDFSNLTAHGGFFPNGGLAVTAGVVTVIFSMVGAEIATIAAAESDNPERAVSKAANSVITRIAIFFVGSIFLLAVILPWNSATLEASPYVAAFQEMGIPYADHVMNAVVLTAVLVLPQLRPLHRVPDALRAGRPPRGTRLDGLGQLPWRADGRHPGLVGRRLPRRHHGGRLARHRLLVPAQLVRRRHPLRLPAHRRLADHPALPG